MEEKIFCKSCISFVYKATAKLCTSSFGFFHTKAQLALYNIVQSDLNLIHDNFLLLIKFKFNPVAFTFDIK